MKLSPVVCFVYVCLKNAKNEQYNQMTAKVKWLPQYQPSVLPHEYFFNWSNLEADIQLFVYQASTDTDTDSHQERRH